MLKIISPYNFEPEKNYIFDVIFNDFLGLQFQVEFKDIDNYLIFVNGKKIVLRDTFFANFDEAEGYLHEENIPEKVSFANNIFTPEKNIPIIFGTTEFYKKKDIICGIDVFASAFFMLSRWEENVIKQKDAHSRFPCELSLAQKYSFSHRAVVNEYVEMLWNMLQHLGCTQQRKKHKFEIIPTHDIDFIKQYPSFFKGIKNVFGDLFKRKNPSLAFDTLKNFFATKILKNNDPFNTFERLMNISENHNLKSHFYFIAGKLGEADVKYDFLSNDIKILLERISQKDHYIGIHGGYDSFNDFEQLQIELNRFKKFGINVTEGRQHFLRFQNPETWQILEKNDVKYDSSIGYTNTSGFRAGTCYEYPVFNILHRKKMKIIERPLIFMETVSQKKYPELKDFENHLLFLKKTVVKYNGSFVVLWHNSNITSKLWAKYFEIYLKILSSNK